MIRLFSFIIFSISIHALREEGDEIYHTRLKLKAEFLSTPSARRATASLHTCQRGWWDFYPRPPRGGRRSGHPASGPSPRISIHALREEGDDSQTATAEDHFNFYPRPPRGGRPAASLCAVRRRGYFYPRPPRGGRPSNSFIISWSMLISIHALREEGDALHLLLTPVRWNFYPRPPRGGRLGGGGQRQDHQHFYPRPPRGGRPLGAHRAGQHYIISIHALREEGDE